VDSPAQQVAQPLSELEQLVRRNRSDRDPDLERRLLGLRQRAGAAMVADAEGMTPGPLAEPASDRLPERQGADLPEFSPSQLGPEVLRAAILRDGCMLVRGLIERDAAVELAREIDRAFAARAAQQADDGATDSYYEELTYEPSDERLENLESQRPWIASGGGVLAADSPRVSFEMLDWFDRAGLSAAIAGYLGERPVISAQKCTLRKAEPTTIGAWHQDGAFMGEVRSVNVWLSLSRCGDVAPGLDLVPRRLDRLVPTGGEGTFIADQVSPFTAAEAAGDLGIIRPIFEPGDVLLFDDLFLHQTASDPAMPNPRFAIESWFFSPVAFPERYVPLAV
jgi:hypothetical protein